MIAFPGEHHGRSRSPRHWCAASPTAPRRPGKGAIVRLDGKPAGASDATFQRGAPRWLMTTP